MTARSPSAFLTSAAFHAALVALVFLFSYVTNPASRDMPKIFEVVAGDGDNYTATEAPALGSPGGVKLDLPKPPTPKVEPVKAEPLPPEPTPITPTPPTVTPKPVAEPKPVESKATPKPVEKKTPTIKQQIRQQIWRAEANAKKKAAKERAEEAKRITKEQFDRANREKAAVKPGPVKVAKIDEKGIAKGVLGGSTANTTGGAGGKALTAPERSAVDAYVAALIQRLKEELDRTPGLEDGLTAEAEFQILADGRLTRGQITRSSRNEAFDLAVLRAITAVRMGPRPKGLDQMQTVPFSTHAKN